MTKRKRGVPLYVRQACELERAEAKKAQGVDKSEGISQRVHMHRVSQMLDKAERERWARVDPANRLRYVEPFTVDYRQLKSEVLGYSESVIEERDEGRCLVHRGIWVR